MAFRFPTLFVSHGTPMLAFGEDRFQQMLHDFSSSIPKPKGIVVLSAHSVSREDVSILDAKTHTIQHDFSGFPKELYEIDYTCPGDHDLAKKVTDLVSADGFKVQTETRSPLDHGVWVPLMHLYPEGNVPLVRVSLPLQLVPAKILKLGKALAPLRNQGIMIMASGGAVHNLRELQWSAKNGEGEAWAKQFEEWLILALKHKNVEDILSAMEEQPEFKRAHPTDEHFLPILFAIGATLPGDEAQILHQGIEYGTLSMLSFSLNSSGSKTEHDSNAKLH